MANFGSFMVYLLEEYEDIIMKIKLIIYSEMGRTLSVAKRIQSALEAAGHSVTTLEIKTSDAVRPGVTQLNFTNFPSIDDADFIIFGAQVMAFQLSPAMNIYLNQVGGLKGKKCSCFLTQHFPFAWMGGNNAISQMKKKCEQKGATTVATAVINWSNKKREKQIEDASKLFVNNL